LVYETAYADVQRDDFNVGFSDGSPQRSAREHVCAGHERDGRSLLMLTDRNFSDAFQTPSQRHVHGRCAGRSRNAPYVRNDAAKAVTGICHGRRRAAPDAHTERRYRHQ
jgi:hypothetical protein